jgi:hypothetical protein
MFEDAYKSYIHSNFYFCIKEFNDRLISSIKHIILWIFKYLTSIYDLYTSANMRKFRIDRVFTKHLLF